MNATACLNLQPQQGLTQGWPCTWHYLQVGMANLLATVGVSATQIAFAPSSALAKASALLPAAIGAAMVVSKREPGIFTKDSKPAAKAPGPKRR